MRVRGRPLEQREDGKNRRSILVLECDADKLETQKHTLAPELYAFIRTLVPPDSCYLLRATSESSLRQECVKCVQDFGHFEIVVVVGHSSRSGLVIARNTRVEWSILPRWLAPFRPRHVLLVACKGGMYSPVKALFDGISTVQEVYASPVAVSDQQAAIVKPIVGYILLGGSPPKNIFKAGQLINLVLTGGLFIRLTRTEFRKLGPIEIEVLSNADTLLEPFRQERSNAGRGGR